MDELGSMFFMMIAAVVSLLGLILLAKADAGGMQLAGSVLFLFGIVFVVGQIRRLTPWN
jgi:hypothetical protein